MIDKIDRNEVLRYLRCKSADDATEGYIEASEKFLLEKARPKYIYKCYACDTSGEGTSIGGQVNFSGSDIKKHLSLSKKCVIMAVTLGLDTDREIRKKSISSVAEAVVLDACATAYTEQLCDMVQKEISDKYGSLNYRYSPGYGDFPIEEQTELLRLLDAQRKIGLTLSASKMLVPSKSVTAVIGIIGNKAECAENKCERCPNKMRCEFTNGI